MTNAKVFYRAVHASTQWRKVNGHSSLENALLGIKDGAPGLFSRRVRIDYEKHGDPLYVVVWEAGSSRGFVVKKSSAPSSEVLIAQVPIDTVLDYESRGGASASELEGHFLS